MPIGRTLQKMFKGTGGFGSIYLKNPTSLFERKPFYLGEQLHKYVMEYVPGRRLRWDKNVVKYNETYTYFLNNSQELITKYVQENIIDTGLRPMLIFPDVAPKTRDQDIFIEFNLGDNPDLTIRSMESYFIENHRRSIENHRRSTEIARLINELKDIYMEELGRIETCSIYVSIDKYIRRRHKIDDEDMLRRSVQQEREILNSGQKTPFQIYAQKMYYIDILNDNLRDYKSTYESIYMRRYASYASLLHYDDNYSNFHIRPDYGPRIYLTDYYLSKSIEELHAIVQSRRQPITDYIYIPILIQLPYNFPDKAPGAIPEVIEEINLGPKSTYEAPISLNLHNVGTNMVNFIRTNNNGINVSDRDHWKKLYSEQEYIGLPAPKIHPLTRRPISNYTVKKYKIRSYAPEPSVENRSTIRANNTLPSTPANNKSTFSSVNPLRMPTSGSTISFATPLPLSRRGGRRRRVSKTLKKRVRKS